MSNPATVELVDVKPEAQKVPAYAVVVGDLVFDAFGREHRITEIVARRVRGCAEPLIWIRRDDRPRQWEPWVFADETVTIIPSLAARQERP